MFQVLSDNAFIDTRKLYNLRILHEIETMFRKNSSVYYLEDEIVSKFAVEAPKIFTVEPREFLESSL